jgi:hypothetical protein
MSGEEIGSETTCEAIKDGDFDHPGPCKARFDEEGVTIRFSASLFPEDDEFDVQFTTEKSHETDVVPSDRDDDSVWVEFDLEG